MKMQKKCPLKRIFIVLFSLELLLFGCAGQQDKESSSSSWVVEDFYVYDKNGEIQNYPDNEELSFFDDVKGLSNLYEKNGGIDNLNFYTKRGVSVHCAAKMAFSEYDLSGFYGSLTKWPILGSLNESEKEIAASFFEKYPDLNEAVKHTNEIKGGLALFISGTFQADDNGNVIQIKLDEKGNPLEELDKSKDFYEIIFYIRDDNVFEWSVSHYSK